MAIAFNENHKGAAQSATVRRTLNVEAAAADVSSSVDELRDAIVALEQHLAPLLSGERPVPCETDRPDGESEVAERLRQQAALIRGSSDRVRMLIERL